MPNLRFRSESVQWGTCQSPSCSVTEDRANDCVDFFRQQFSDEEGRRGGGGGGGGRGGGGELRKVTLEGSDKGEED